MRFQAEFFIPIAAILLGISFFLSNLFLRPPGINFDVGTENNFSAEQASSHLARLIGDNEPRASGSRSQIRFIERLSASLDEYGLESEVGDSYACRKSGHVCARVRNLVGRIDGESDDAILLMAHYDTVPSSPGAGDNGAGVAALLEIARILKEGTKPKNSIIFLFSDAEEIGHLGAQEFFENHPWSESVRAVINVDGAGSSGGVYVLRLAPNSGHILAAFRSVAPYPIAKSVRQAAFERMGSGSDFAVAIKYGKPGIDFSFTGQRKNNHSSLDTLENLDVRVIQHHGKNVLPLVRKLADMDLTLTEPNPVYYVLGHDIWLTWSPGAGVALSFLAVAFLLFSVWRFRTEVSFRKVILGAFFTLIQVSLFFVAILFLIYCLDTLTDRNSRWPADSAPWIIAFFASPIFILFSTTQFALRVTNRLELLIGAWLLWGFVTLIISVYIPSAASLLIPPLVLTAVLLLAMFTIKHKFHDTHVMLITVLAGTFASYFVFTFLLENATVAGLARIQIMALVYAMLVAMFQSLVSNHGGVYAHPILRTVAGGVILGSIIYAPYTEPYTPTHPARANIQYIQSLNSKQAMFSVHVDDPLPKWVAQHNSEFTNTSNPFPWAQKHQPYVWQAPWTPIDAPDYAATYDNNNHSQSVLNVELFSQRHAEIIDLWLEEPGNIEYVTVMGEPVNIKKTNKAYLRIRFYAPYEDKISLEIGLRTKKRLKAYLADTLYQLPDVAEPLAQERAPSHAPYYEGDSWVVYREIKL